MDLTSVVLMDLDGTLSDTDIPYRDGVDEFRYTMENIGFAAQLAEDTAMGVEHAKALDGADWTRTRFAESMVQAYTLMCGAARRPVINPMKAAIHAIGMNVLTARAPMIEGADQMIADLAKRYRLHIYSMGDWEVQQRRLRDIGLHASFAEQHIIPRKHPAALTHIVASLRARDLEVRWVVGNSLRYDIGPALVCGIRAVLCGKGAAPYDHDQVGAKYIQAKRLIDIPDLMAAEEARIPTLVGL